MAINDGLTRPRGNKIDAVEHEVSAESKRVTLVSSTGTGLNTDINGNLQVVVIENTQQERFDYGSRDDGQPVYAGSADRGVATSASTWTLKQFTYDLSGFMTLKQTATDSWDNRAGANYA
jgi:hypothetical protein